MYETRVCVRLRYFFDLQIVCILTINILCCSSYIHPKNIAMGQVKYVCERICFGREWANSSVSSVFVCTFNRWRNNGKSLKLNFHFTV